MTFTGLAHVKFLSITLGDLKIKCLLIFDLQQTITNQAQNKFNYCLPEGGGNTTKNATALGQGGLKLLWLKGC